MRGDDFEARRLRRLDLGLEEPRVGAREKVNQVELVIDCVIEALDPLRWLALVLPDLEFEADVLGDLLHCGLDCLDERHRARSGDGKNGLVFHAGGRVEGLSGRLEFRHLTIGFELLFGPSRLGALRQRGGPRELHDSE